MSGENDYNPTFAKDKTYHCDNNDLMGCSWRLNQLLEKAYTATNKMQALRYTGLALHIVQEAIKFNIEGIEYSKDGKYKSKIVVCNYERLSYFNSDDFDCVILDNRQFWKTLTAQLSSKLPAFWSGWNIGFCLLPPRRLMILWNLEPVAKP